MEREGFELINGDLFLAPDDFSLAHCVSKDLSMGKGIALLFRERFGKVKKLKSQNPQIGNIVSLHIPPKYIFYLVTKERYYHRPTYESLQQSLNALKSACEANNISKLAMPKLGCGLDELDWEVVSKMLESTFPAGQFSLKVYYI